MPTCELYETCIFFNDKMLNMPSTTKVLKVKYCTHAGSGCARLVVCNALGRSRIPADLFPNNMNKALEIIAQG